LEIPDADNKSKLQAKLVSNSNFLTSQENSFFLNGIYYSLDEGLLMGDPLFRFTALPNKIVPMKQPSNTNNQTAQA
jgi:hypothetical protein